MKIENKLVNLKWNLFKTQVVATSISITRPRFENGN